MLRLGGAPFNIKGGGADGVFVGNKLFISTRLGGALKMLNSITCSYMELLLK